LAAVDAIEVGTHYSRECCALLAESGGIGALLAFVRSCNRSKPHVEVMRCPMHGMLQPAMSSVCQLCCNLESLCV
jgi:abnormal spindle-like microcephaly-associated protein